MSKYYPQMPSPRRRKRPSRTSPDVQSEDSSYSALLGNLAALYSLPLLECSWNPARDDPDVRLATNKAVAALPRRLGLRRRVSGRCAYMHGSMATHADC